MQVTCLKGFNVQCIEGYTLNAMYGNADDNNNRILFT